MNSNPIPQKEIIFHLIDSDSLLSSSEYRVHHSLIENNQDLFSNKYNKDITEKQEIDEYQELNCNSPIMTWELSFKDEKCIHCEFPFSSNAKSRAYSINELNTFVKVAQRRTSYKTNLLLLDNEIMKKELSILSTKSRHSEISKDIIDNPWENVLEESQAQLPNISTPFKKMSKIDLLEEEFPNTTKEAMTKSNKILKMENETREKIKQTRTLSLNYERLDSTHFSIQSNYSSQTIKQTIDPTPNNSPIKEVLNEEDFLGFHDSFFNLSKDSILEEEALEPDNNISNHEPSPAEQTEYLQMGYL